MKNRILALIVMLALLCMTLCSCSIVDEIVGEIDGIIDDEINDILGDDDDDSKAPAGSGTVSDFDLSIVPDYDGVAYYIINNNVPFFTEEEIVTTSYEKYADLDPLGRCTLTEACIGRDIMPTEEREGKLSDPTGWVQAEYSIVSGTYLYNRCHLIGHQLTGENDNRKNLITGTRYFNIDGMVGFENQTADYIKETGNHVMYRVTPIFKGEELVARGVLMEIYSVEDEGEGLCYNHFIYNVQPGIVIDYATGNSRLCEAGEDENSNFNPAAPDEDDKNTDNNGGSTGSGGNDSENGSNSDDSAFSLDDVPAYSGSPHYLVNGGVPFFTAEEITTTSYEYYGALDSLGRCTVVMACIGQDLMPTGDRKGDLPDPTGYQFITYPIISGGNLYNRCHLIGWQLTGEMNNRQNLITGTRYFNIDGMVGFENQTADYIKETGNHVMYRVTPMFSGNDLVARGILLEAYSVEDEGEGISYCVYIYNVQPGIIIDYATGNSQQDPDYEDDTVIKEQPENATFVINVSKKKVHRLTCSSVTQMNESNKEYTTKTAEELKALGIYSACGNCHPW